MPNVNVEDLLKKLYRKVIILTSITIFRKKLLISQAPLIIDRKQQHSLYTYSYYSNTTIQMT